MPSFYKIEEYYTNSRTYASSPKSIRKTIRETITNVRSRSIENPTIANNTRRNGVLIRRRTPADNNCGLTVADGKNHVPIKPARNNMTLPQTPVRSAREVRNSTGSGGRDGIGCSGIIGR